ncbi:MAG: ATP-binding protein [Myxococcaceae bacterium]
MSEPRVTNQVEEAENRARRESVLQRKVLLGEMLDLPTFNELVKGFVELYKVGIKVFDERGGKIADIKIGNGDFCGYVFSMGEGRNRCTNTVMRVKDGPIEPTKGGQPLTHADVGPRGAVAVHCFTGLRYLVSPILHEGDAIGRVVFGPFTPEDLEGLPKTLLEISPDLDQAKALQLMEKIRRAPEGTVARVMAHFLQLIDTLVAAGQKTYLTSQMHIEATLESNRELEAKNKRLEDMNAKLKELDRLKSSFLATVSHELRTPLTSIIGYSEMLSEGLAGKLNPEQLVYVKTIMDKGETLLKMISSILYLNQIEAGKVRLNFESLNLADLIESGVTSVKPQAQKKAVTLDVRVPQNKIHANADREKLRQVVVNLLANAVKFTSKGGKVSIFLSELAHQPELNGDGYRIIVEDSGVGIPHDQFDRIFESFYQVDSSSTREFGGAGLGLAIVKSFVEGHGGKVRVSSEVGHGSRFTAVLPVTPPTKVMNTISVPAPLPPEPDRF